MRNPRTNTGEMLPTFDVSSWHAGGGVATSSLLSQVYGFPAGGA
jgi:hypothetical protein